MAEKKALRSVDFDTKPFDGTTVEAVRQAIENGDILVQTGTTVEIREAGVEIPYPALLAVNGVGAAALFGGQVDITYWEDGARKGQPKRSESVAGAASYGADLMVRSKIRSAWEQANLAPEKAWDKDVLALATTLPSLKKLYATDKAAALAKAEAMLIAEGAVKPTAAPAEPEPEAEPVE